MGAIEKKIVQLEEAKLSKMLCPECKGENHNWRSVYQEERARLVRMDDVYVSWCMSSGKHVLYTPE